MNDTKQKILTRLSDLINQIPELKKVKYDSESVKLWEERVKKLLERIGGEKIIKDFNKISSFAMSMFAKTDTEHEEIFLKRLTARNSFLVALKEDLELFDESDEPELKKIKHKFELGADLGIIKGKYSQEREKDK